MKLIHKLLIAIMALSSMSGALANPKIEFAKNMYSNLSTKAHEHPYLAAGVVCYTLGFVWGESVHLKAQRNKKKLLEKHDVDSLTQKQAENLTSYENKIKNRWRNSLFNVPVSLSFFGACLYGLCKAYGSLWSKVKNVAQS